MENQIPFSPQKADALHLTLKQRRLIFNPLVQIQQHTAQAEIAYAKSAEQLQQLLAQSPDDPEIAALTHHYAILSHHLTSLQTVLNHLHQLRNTQFSQTS